MGREHSSVMILVFEGHCYAWQYKSFFLVKFNPQECEIPLGMRLKFTPEIFQHDSLRMEKVQQSCSWKAN